MLLLQRNFYHRPRISVFNLGKVIPLIKDCLWWKSKSTAIRMSGMKPSRVFIFQCKLRCFPGNEVLNDIVICLMPPRLVVAILLALQDTG